MKDRVYLPLLDIENIMPILHKISIFGGLNERQLQILFSLLQKTTFQKGETIFRLGDAPSHLYIVKSGRIKLVIESDNTYLELIELGVGKCFGETAFIGLEPHTAGAVAVEDSELIVFSSRVLMELLKSDRDLFSIIILNIAREACRRLNNTENILLHYFLKK